MQCKPKKSSDLRPQTALQMLKSIIVDDDEIVTFLQRKLLSKCNIDQDPLVFNRANNAIMHLRKNSDTQDHFLIMLDINMPEMDGWEFLEELKKIDINKRVYVVMVTSSVDRKDKRRAAENENVIDFIEKPISSRNCSKLKGISKLAPFFPK